jgi:hypothetical protein
VTTSGSWVAVARAGAALPSAAAAAAVAASSSSSGTSCTASIFASGSLAFVPPPAAATGHVPPRTFARFPTRPPRAWWPIGHPPSLALAPTAPGNVTEGRSIQAIVGMELKGVRWS